MIQLWFFLTCFLSNEALAEVSTIIVKGEEALNANQIVELGQKPLQDVSFQASPRAWLDGVKGKEWATRILQLYKRSGYETATVKFEVTSLNEGASDEMLIVEINEGLPIRISHIEFEEVEPVSPRALLFQKRRIEKYEDLSKLRTGGVFNEEWIGDLRRSLLEWLSSKDYIGSNLTDVEIEEVPEPEWSERPPASKWVRLVVRIQRGDHVEFGFRGHKFFSRADFENVIREQQVAGMGSNYVAVIRTRILEEYRLKGFGKARVLALEQALPRPDLRRVTFLINEGKRSVIEKISFEGNIHFGAEELEEQFFARATPMIQKRIFVEAEAQRAAELLIEYLKERGFLHARLISLVNESAERSRKKSKKGGVELVLYLYEGAQTFVRGWHFVGNQYQTDAWIAEQLGLKFGHALNVFELAERLQSLKRSYKELGFLDIEILNEGRPDLVRYYNMNRDSEVHLVLLEGKRNRLHSVELEGLRYTSELVVRQELSLQKEDLLTQTVLDEVERDLRRMNIFTTTSLRLVPVERAENGDAYKRLVIRFEEAERRMIGASLGFRNDLGVMVTGQGSMNNLWGFAHSTGLRASVNRRLFLKDVPDPIALEGGASLFYDWPSFAGWRGMGFRPSLEFGNRLIFTPENLVFRQVNLRLELLWIRRLFGRHSPLLAQVGLAPDLNLEDILRQADKPLVTTEVGGEKSRQVQESVDQRLFLNTLFGVLSFDLRDSPVAPTKGFFASLTGEYAPSWLGSYVEKTDPALKQAPKGLNLLRFMLRVDHYTPLPAGAGLFLSFRSGVAHALNRGEIPLIRQFRLGGPESLRGYAFQTVALSEGTGDFLAYVNYRAQIEVPLFSLFRFATFVDAANLGFRHYSLTEGLLWGPGVGLHARTPVGDVNLDVGFHFPSFNARSPGFVRPILSEDRPADFQVHLSVGVI
jgi:outer membrane protein assembly factor BamA